MPVDAMRRDTGFIIRNEEVPSKGFLTNTARQGDNGPVVSIIQQALNRNGANLVVDGDFGPATQAAVINFQRSNRLDADGIVGPQTRAALGL